MTGASPASATALPSDRRTLLSGAALASLVAATAAVPAIAEPLHPDAKLLDLLPLLRQAASERSRHASACDEAWDRIDYPAFPDAVVWRKSDWPGVWVDKARLDTVGKGEGLQHVYATEGVPESLQAMLARWEATPPVDRNVPERCIARLKEILAGAEEWTARMKAAEDACGYTASNKAFNESDEVIQGLLQQIIEIPARTAEGVVVTIYAALIASLKSAKLIERHRLADLVALRHRSRDEVEEALLLSAQVAASKITASGLVGGAHA